MNNYPLVFLLFLSHCISFDNYNILQTNTTKQNKNTKQSCQNKQKTSMTILYPYLQATAINMSSLILLGKNSDKIKI